MLTKDALLEDIRQLTEIIESAHPDPYFKGGGRIAYHRRLQKLMWDVPAEGMTAQEFNFYLMPFVASLKDGHTTVFDEKSWLVDGRYGGIPIFFGAIEEKLYVRAVTSDTDKDLIGRLLVSVEGIRTEELLQRVEQFFGCENQYQSLGKLGSYLIYSEMLKLLIPEWQPDKDHREVTVELKHPDGKIASHRFECIQSDPTTRINTEAADHLPKLYNPENPYFFYKFIDQSGREPGEVAYLRIANMITFREAFEYFHANGMVDFEDLAKRVFQRFHPQTDLPGNYADVLAGIPAASEVFSKLFEAMKVAETRFLVVDLRDNQGGNSLMNQILTYYLVGFEKTIEIIQNNGTVRKISTLLAGSTEQGIDLTQIFYHLNVPLKYTDYDFSLDPSFSAEHYQKAIRDGLERDFATMPSFFPEFHSRENEALYYPEHIFILSSEFTFSTGYNLMADLFQLGGEIVGVPSGQAGNSCGDIRSFELDHSKITGHVSTKSIIAFPDDPDLGTLLNPHHPLKYQQLKAYHFDENATLRFALEIIAEISKKTRPVG